MYLALREEALVAEENQEVAVKAAQQDAPDLEHESVVQAQEEAGDPPLDDVPSDVIEEEDPSLNPPDQFKEDKDAKQNPRKARDAKGG
jgi:hypothetical protein